MALVLVASWQHECCGDLFAVGDEVTWPVASGTSDGVVRALGEDWGRRLYLSVERHDEDVPSLSGTVRSIQSVFCRHEWVAEDPAGPHYRSAAGTGVLQRVERTARHEHRDGLEWSGYLVDLDTTSPAPLARAPLDDAL